MLLLGPWGDVDKILALSQQEIPVASVRGEQRDQDTKFFVFVVWKY